MVHLSVFSMLLGSSLASASRIQVPERFACEWTDLVVVGTVQEGAYLRQHVQPHPSTSTWLPISLERVVFYSEEGAKGLEQERFGIDVSGDWTVGRTPAVIGDEWNPGARYLLLLAYGGVDESGVVLWSRVGQVPIGYYEVVAPESVLFRYWARHCSAHRTDVQPIPDGMWNALFTDHLAASFGSLCTHSE